MRKERPAQRDVNSIDDLTAFICRWDSPKKAENQPHKSFKRSPVGNINFRGEIAGSFAYPYFPDEVDFWSSIEPGVRCLVSVIISDGGFITYTSCEGHQYDSESGAECHVGIVPRKFQELVILYRALKKVEADLSGYLHHSRFEVVPGHLLDCRSNIKVSVIDFYLRKLSDVSWSRYLDTLTFEAQLASESMRENLAVF